MGVVKLNMWGVSHLYKHCLVEIALITFPGNFTSIYLETTPSKVNWQTYKKTLRRVLFNALVTTAVFQLTMYPLMVWRGMPCGYELPSFQRVIWDTFIYVVIVETGFYYSHRYAMKEWSDDVWKDEVMFGWRWGDGWVEIQWVECTSY